MINFILPFRPRNVLPSANMRKKKSFSNYANIVHTDRKAVFWPFGGLYLTLHFSHYYLLSVKSYSRGMAFIEDFLLCPGLTGWTFGTLSHISCPNLCHLRKYDLAGPSPQGKPGHMPTYPLLLGLHNFHSLLACHHSFWDERGSLLRRHYQEYLLIDVPLNIKKLNRN